MKTRILPAVLGVLAVVLACDARNGAAPAHDHNATAAPARTSNSDLGGHNGHPTLPGYGPVEVDGARQQLLGIRTAVVERQTIERRIRTVGIVQADETRTSHVHVKFEGFIEKIFVNFTGRAVRKGQPLFEIFSRDLLAAQQEYLAAREAVRRVPPAAGDAVRGAAEQLATAARERLRLFDVPPSVLATLDRTGVAQRAITIASPQAGTVVEKQAIEGLAVTPMMALYVVADLARVWVVADVYERDMAQVKLGDAAMLRLEALPGRAFDGKVSFISPTVDETTRTAKVRFEFPNRQGVLRPGMYATAEIASRGVVAGLTVPADAVVDTGERKIVFVAAGPGRFEPRQIATGAAVEGRYEVLEGLKEGEAVAITGQFLLDSESRIRGGRSTGPAHGGH
jgi:membrane fusion protein, copper/silver efflux system